ncbi:MAG: hypothetical protein V4857_19010 [Pseudomonadota bacterium]
MPEAPDVVEIKKGTCIVIARTNLRSVMSGTDFSTTTASAQFRALIESTAAIIIGAEQGTASYGSFPFVVGDDFHAVTLSVGQYYWSRLELGAFGYATVRGYQGNPYAFDCKESRVSYIGDIDIEVNPGSRKYGIVFVDRSSSAKFDFERRYPKMSAAHAMTSTPIVSQGWKSGAR